MRPASATRRWKSSLVMPGKRRPRCGRPAARRVRRSRPVGRRRASSRRAARVNNLCPEASSTMYRASGRRSRSSPSTGVGVEGLDVPTLPVVTVAAHRHGTVGAHDVVGGETELLDIAARGHPAASGRDGHHVSGIAHARDRLGHTGAHGLVCSRMVPSTSSPTSQCPVIEQPARHRAAGSLRARQGRGAAPRAHAPIRRPADASRAGRRSSAWWRACR